MKQMKSKSLLAIPEWCCGTALLSMVGQRVKLSTICAAVGFGWEFMCGNLKAKLHSEKWISMLANEQRSMSYVVQFTLFNSTGWRIYWFGDFYQSQISLQWWARESTDPPTFELTPSTIYGMNLGKKRERKKKIHNLLVYIFQRDT